MAICTKSASLIVALLILGTPGVAFRHSEWRDATNRMMNSAPRASHCRYRPTSRTHLHSSKQSRSPADSGSMSPWDFFSDTPTALPGWLSAPKPPLSDDALGYAAIFAAPVIWGTFPVVRMLYEIDPAVPGTVFSAMYFTVASLSTLALLTIIPQLDASNAETYTPVWSQENKPAADGMEASKANMYLDAIATKKPGAGLVSKLNFLELPAGGIEIGTYLFLGNTLQCVGLETVPADRAGFLVSLSTIFVPLVEAVLKGSFMTISPRTWTACAVALAGIGVMGLDQTGTVDTLDNAVEAGSSMFSGFSVGDTLTVGAALMYSMSVIRLGKYSQETTPLKITASKASMEAVLAVAYVAGSSWIAGHTDPSDAGILNFFQQTGSDINAFVDTVANRWQEGTLALENLVKIGGATLYTGWVATAALVYVQSFGQQKVKPTDANLIYSLQPLFTSLFSFMLLGECMAPVGYVGASLILGSIVLVATRDSDE